MGSSERGERENELAEKAEFSVDGLEIKSFGIECASDPFLHVFMLGVVWLLECLQELLVAANAAYVFRGCGSLTGKADGARHLLTLRENLLNDKVVFPIVSEVVHVDEARLLVSHQVPKHVLPFVSNLGGFSAPLTGSAVFHVANHELMKMRVHPRGMTNCPDFAA